MKNRWFKNIVGLLIGCIIAFLLLEVFLRIYNPFDSRLDGDKIVLPRNKAYHYSTNGVIGVDSFVKHYKNEIGFRGENPPKDLGKFKSMVFVGGSTTECTACGKGDDWAAVTNKIITKQHPDFWSNNAGLDGHSTFGHTILLEDYLIKLKPNYITFLIGVNDIGRKDLARFEHYHLRKGNTTWKQNIVSNSEVLKLIINIKRSKRAMDLDLGHKNKPFSEYGTSTMKYDSTFDRENIDAYKNRVKRLVTVCKSNRIEPIFITQPTVMGADSIFNGVNFKTIKIRSYNGTAFNETLKEYNSITKEICKENNLLLIDLWEQLPKNPLYFYDEVHFTKAGCKKVGEIVANELNLHFQ